MQASGGAVAAYSVGPPLPGGTLRLHLNEFQYDHPEDVAGAAARLDPADRLTRYATGADPELAAALAEYVGVPGAAHVAVTAGSDEALRAVVHAAALRGFDTVVMGTPGYTHFEQFAALGRLRVATFATAWGATAAALEASLLYFSELIERGCLVYLGNPNNPTGEMWPRDVVARLAAGFPNSLFLVDEAYIEYASVAGAGAGAGEGAGEGAREGAGEGAREGAGAGAGVGAGEATGEGAGEGAGEAAPAQRLNAQRLNALSLAPLAAATPNVVVVRTMSKAFGLAAVRVGYAVGAPALIRELGVVISPKAFGAAAAATARAALRNVGHYCRAAAEARAESARAVVALRSAGWLALDTPGNFYLVYAGDAAALVAALAAGGIAVRDRSGLPGLAGFVRVSAGDPAGTDRLLGAFAGLAPPADPPAQLLYTDKGHVAACKTLMKRTLRVLRGANLEFFATAGTLLGMLRHGGMIPWDDDCDLAYVRDPLRDQGLDLVAAFGAAGLTLQRNRTDAYWQVGTNAPGEPISAAHVDLFSYSRAADGAFEADDPRFSAEAPDSPRADCNARFAPAELYPLRRGVMFYDEEIPVPAGAEAALARALGAGYMTAARVRPRRAGAPPAEFLLRDFAPA